jgi:hypothetical protein
MPAPRCGSRIIVEHDAAAVAKTQQRHAAGEFLGRGQGVLHRRVIVDQPARSMKIAPQICPASNSARASRFASGRWLLASMMRRSEVMLSRQPFGAYQTFHDPARASVRCDCEGITSLRREPQWR